MTYAVNAKLTRRGRQQDAVGSVSSVKDTVYGTLGATTNVTFSTPASGDVAQTLNGTLTMTLANGKIMKLDLPGELSKIGKFGGVTPKGYTAISQMSGSYNIHDGVAQTNDTKAALDIGTMAAEGTINLVNQASSMHVTAVLNKGFSQSVGGTGVGGYLNTALANKNGELVLPVLITGKHEPSHGRARRAADRQDEAEQSAADRGRTAERQGRQQPWRAGGWPSRQDNNSSSNRRSQVSRRSSSNRLIPWATR